MTCNPKRFVFSFFSQIFRTQPLNFSKKMFLTLNNFPNNLHKCRWLDSRILILNLDLKLIGGLIGEKSRGLTDSADLDCVPTP